MALRCERDVDRLFWEVVQIESADERAAWVDALAVRNPEVGTQLQRLLRARDNLGTFMEGPAASVGDGDDSCELRIGRYTLVEQIGEGGMGLVFRAIQREPLQREVAVKVVRPDRDSEYVLERFYAERTFLARMEHPYIARILDAGTTDGNIPYFVMELVRGTAITDFCDARRLTVPLRVALMRKVCRALHHAHRRGVVHLDLKPGNILVHDLDGEYFPKIIDFGVARERQADASEAVPAFTDPWQAGTPAYMSPEQLGGGERLDQRSDVYSLGIILYELLCGVPPFDEEKAFSSKSSTTTDHPFRESERRLDDILPPSRRLAALDPARRETIAAQRGMTPEELLEILKAHFDALVMHALAVSPQDRMPTMARFAEVLNLRMSE